MSIGVSVSDVHLYVGHPLSCEYSAFKTSQTCMKRSFFFTLNGFTTGFGDLVVGGLEGVQVMGSGVELKRIVVGQGRENKGDELLFGNVAAHDVERHLAHVARVVLGAYKDTTVVE